MQNCKVMLCCRFLFHCSLRERAANHEQRDAGYLGEGHAPRKLIVGAALAGMLGLPAALYGQGNAAPVDPPKSVPLHLGPVALAPTLSLVNVGWDSNVYHLPVDADVEDDFTMIARPEVQAWLRLGRARAHGRSIWDFAYFRDHPSERSVDMGHEGRLLLPLTRVTPYVSGRWVSARQRTGFEIDERTRRHEVGGDAGVDLRLLSRTNVDIAVRRSRVEFDRTNVSGDSLVSEFDDYTSRGVGVTVRQQLTPLTSLAVTVDRYQDRFDLVPERDSNSLAIASGLEFKPFALISGKAYAGWRRFELVQPGSPPFEGFVASVDLAYTLLGATRFAVEGIRDISYSAMQGQHAYLLSGATASVNHRLSGRWDIGARIGRHRVSYGLFALTDEPGAEPPAANVNSDQEINVQYGGEVGYRVVPEMRVGFDLGHSNRRSTVVSSREYERTYATMSLNYQF
jgi:hypothetical protein